MNIGDSPLKNISNWYLGRLRPCGKVTVTYSLARYEKTEGEQIGEEKDKKVISRRLSH